MSNAGRKLVIVRGALLQINQIPYTAKLSRGKTFAVFADFYSTANVFQ